MKNSIKSLLNEAAGIRQYVTPLTYKTILGQIRSGDIAGAAKGISRIRRRHIKDNKTGNLTTGERRGETMNIFNYLDHITLEDAIKYAAQGYVFEINDGHVQTMRVLEEGTEDLNDGL